MADKFPARMIRAFKVGLKWHSEGFSGDGLKPETVRRAQGVVDGDTTPSDDWVKEASAWHSRHHSNGVSKIDARKADPVPLDVATALWGILGPSDAKWWDNQAQELAETMKDAIAIVIKDTYSVGGLHRLDFSDDTYLSVEDVEKWLAANFYAIEDDEAITKTGNRWVATIRAESKFQSGNPRFHPLPLGDGVTAYIGVPLPKQAKPPRKTNKPVEGGPIVPEIVDVESLASGGEVKTEPTLKADEPTADMTDDEAKAAQQARAGRFAIEILESTNLRFPKGFPISLEDYGDPVNLKYPLIPKGRLRNALSRFTANYEEYTKPRSRKIVFSRIVLRALQEGVTVDPDSTLVKTLLAPDLKRRVDEQVQETAKEMVAKLDLGGGTIQDFMALLERAVTSAAKDGLWGTYNHSDHYYPGYIHAVMETEVIVYNYRDVMYYRAGWARNGDTITFSDVQEVKAVVSFISVEPPKPPESVTVQTEKIDLAGQSVEVFRRDMYDAVKKAGLTGIFGPTDHDYCPASLDGVYETYIIVYNYRNDGFYQTDWTKSADGSITFSNVTQVEAVVSFKPVAKQFNKTDLDDVLADWKHLPAEMTQASVLKAVADFEAKIDALPIPNRTQTYKGADGNTVRLVPILKIDAPNRIVSYEVYRPYEKDTHGDWMSPETIYNAMTFWMEKSQEFDADHDYAKRDARVVENWQVKSGDTTAPEGTWMQSAKIMDDSLWKSIEAGEYGYVSIAGTAKPVQGSEPPAMKMKQNAELQEMEVWKVSFVNRGANSGQGVKSFSVFKSGDDFESEALTRIFDSQSSDVSTSKQSMWKRVWDWIVGGPAQSETDSFLKEFESTIRESDMKDVLKGIAQFVRENHQKDPTATVQALKDVHGGVGLLISEIEKTTTKPTETEKTEADKTTEKADMACPSCKAMNTKEAKFCSSCGGSMKPKAEKTENADALKEKTENAAVDPSVALKAEMEALKAQMTDFTKAQQALKDENAVLKAQADKAQTDKATAEKDAAAKAALLKDAGLGGNTTTSDADAGKQNTEKSDPWAEVDAVGRSYKVAGATGRPRVEKASDDDDSW